jgi:hypothetical protein
MSSYGVREGTGTGKWIMGTVTRNPEGLLLLAAGVALLMRSGRGPSVGRNSFRVETKVNTAPEERIALLG